MNLSSELISFCKEHENDDVYTLALQAHLFPHIDIEAAIRQVKGRQIAKSKLPSWYAKEEIAYPVHLSLEQASSEKTALYKQALCKKGDVMIDLTGGLGVDISFLSRQFTKAVYVEQQSYLSSLAKHNFGILDLQNIEVINQDSTTYLQQMDEKVDLIYIDPARRNTQGNKIFLIGDCSPNLLEIQDSLLSKAEQVMIKLSPMLDISLALSKLKDVASVYIIGVDNEVKELLFILQEGYEGELIFNCINIHKRGIEEFSFKSFEEDTVSPQYTSEIGVYLYEPNSTIMKGGAYKLIAERFSLSKLHKSSHLYTSDLYNDDFPGRVFKVKSAFSLTKNDLKDNLKNIHKINITVRNFPMTVDVLRKKLKLADGGDNYLFATTLANNQKILVLCEKF